MNMDTDIDLLNQLFEYNTSINWKPKINFVNDINYIIEELKLYNTFVNLDIYEVLVSCGHNLTWDQEYNLSSEDLQWFKIEGKKYFLNSLNDYNRINSIHEYRAVMDIHFKLTELFELQLYS